MPFDGVFFLPPRFQRATQIYENRETIGWIRSAAICNGSFISRNAGSGFDFFNVNARLSRTFQANEQIRVEAILEAFNLFNRVNGVALNGNFGGGTYPTNPLPTFKQVTAVADPRTLQLALRFSF